MRRLPTPMKRRAGAANLGYYQPSNRFIGIAAPNASAQNSMRAGPQGTAPQFGWSIRRPRPAGRQSERSCGECAAGVGMTGGPTPCRGRGLILQGNLASLAGGNSPGPNQIQFSSCPLSAKHARRHS